MHLSPYTSTVISDMVCLHPSGCVCIRCRPWSTPKDTSGGFPSQAMYVTRWTWESLGKPSSIEGFARALGYPVPDGTNINF